MTDNGKKILEYISANPGKKAAEIASAVGLEKRIVNGILYGELKGKAKQTEGYRWITVVAGKPADTETSRPSQSSNSLISRLCRYYLECLSQEDLGGASVFASSYNDLDYFELKSLPMVSGNGGGNPFETDEGRNFLRRVRGDRNRKAFYLGYPVRLRKVPTGYKIEPLLLFPFDEDGPARAPVISEELPNINFKALESLSGGPGPGLMEEAIQLGEEIGLGSVGENRPDLDDLIYQLRACRSEWDWVEDTDPYSIDGAPALREIAKNGIFNRAIVVAVEKSPYTRGLESELGKLRGFTVQEYQNTVLGAWLESRTSDSRPPDHQPLLEVIPLNEEQRQAVRQSLKNPLTVITGPPGTGKSQVVTAMLVNAAWQGKTVLFASKNNKAVDVVDARVNGLGPRPVLLRMGSNQNQERLAEYLVSLLASSSNPHDDARHKEHLVIHERLGKESREVIKAIESLVELRNEVDRLEQNVEVIRESLGDAKFSQVRNIPLDSIGQDVDAISKAIELADREKQSIFLRMLWPLICSNRYQRLEEEGKAFSATSKGIWLPIPEQAPNRITFSPWRSYPEKLRTRLLQLMEAKVYFKALERLTRSKALDDYYRHLIKLTAEIAKNSEELWDTWLRIQPSRMSRDERKVLGDYTAQLRILVASNNQGTRVGAAVLRKLQELFPKINSILSCWAVTSLSARGRVPFIPGFFDLLIIDEASQCDIASALPLLYRAKRVVVIGDSKQLSHISKISKQQDAQLLDKYTLLEGYARFGYATMSLFDLANASCGPEDIVALRDHHRSHEHIIDFSNQEYYEGRLRVATRYDRLKSPTPDQPAVRWIDVCGTTIRPESGGAINEQEAQAVVREISRLVAQGYKGTIGVVSPFRAQANRIRELAVANRELGNKLAVMEFLADTVHKFQGDERDVMFFSPVVSKGIAKGAIGFLNKTGNLFNVAITRARAALIVVGDRSAILSGEVAYLSRFSKYVAQLVAMKDIREPDHGRDLGAEYPPVSNPESVSDWERIFYRAMYKEGIRAIPQYSVEKYMLDFAVINGTRRLNIEVDGERYHRNWDGELCRRDQIRNQRMIELGWDVKRFWVYQIRDDMSTCIHNVMGWMSGS